MPSSATTGSAKAHTSKMPRSFIFVPKDQCSVSEQAMMSGEMMTQRPFGWTGVRIPVIGQGTWMIEGSADAERRSAGALRALSLIHISEPTRQAEISYAVFCL